MPAAKQTPIPGYTQIIASGNDTLAGVVHTSTPDDFTFILDRSRKWSNEQGFIPAEGMRQLIDEGRGLTLWINGERAGYILTSGGIRRPLIVRHNTIEEDLWSQGFGTLLMRAVLKWSTWSRRHFVLVRTRADLVRQTAINAKLKGFVLGQDPEIGAREQPVNIWSVPNVPTLFQSDVP